MSDLVGNPEDLFSHNEAQIEGNQGPEKLCVKELNCSQIMEELYCLHKLQNMEVNMLYLEPLQSNATNNVFPTT